MVELKRGVRRRKEREGVLGERVVIEERRGGELEGGDVKKLRKVEVKRGVSKGRGEERSGNRVLYVTKEELATVELN